VTTRAAALSAAQVARTLIASIPSVTKLVTLTEDNDPNDLIGRPTGYTAAVVVFDKRVTCSDGLGADCGATVEQWPSAAAAKARSEYIQTVQQAAPMLGTEYHYLTGRVLVRVAGHLKPSQAKAYAAAVA
jgi:hypothetical protein